MAASGRHLPFGRRSQFVNSAEGQYHLEADGSLTISYINGVRKCSMLHLISDFIYRSHCPTHIRNRGVEG